MESLNHGRALFRAYPITYNRDFQMIICIAERRTWKRERETIKESESSYLKVAPLLRRADDIDKLACILVVCQADSPKPQITKDFSPMMLQIPLNIAYKKLQWTQKNCLTFASLVEQNGLKNFFCNGSSCIICRKHYNKWKGHIDTHIISNR